MKALWGSKKIFEGLGRNFEVGDYKKWRLEDIKILMVRENDLRYKMHQISFPHHTTVMTKSAES